MQCDFLQEPDYSMVYKTEIARLGNLTVTQEDAFKIKLEWISLISDTSYTPTFFNLKRASTDSSADQYLADDTTGLGFNNLAAIKDSVEVEVDVDASLETYVRGDTIFYTYIDKDATLNKYQYYKIIAKYEDIISYSLVSSVGVLFNLPTPDSIYVDQIDDYRLQLSWDEVDFADGYRLFREIESVRKSWEVTGTTVMDSSENPSYDLFVDTAFVVDGIQPNQDITYSIEAFAIDTVDVDTVWSMTQEVRTARLELDPPKLRSTVPTRPINSTTVRLYLANEPTVFDTLFIQQREKSGDKWSNTDTTLMDAEGGYLDIMYFGHMPVLDDSSVPLTGLYDFRVVAKGKVNALASTFEPGNALDIPGFTYVESENSIEPFYSAIFEANLAWNDPDGGHGEPVISGIGWCAAKLYCDSLTTVYLAKDYNFRLPTEDEWEYAASWDPIDDQSHTYPWGDDAPTSSNANFLNNGDPYNGLRPAGYFDGTGNTNDSKSFFGLYDMAGNVLEWCQDDITDDTTGCDVPNPDEKPLKGGCYWQDQDYLRTDSTSFYPRNYDFQGLGFRIIMTIGE